MCAGSNLQRTVNFRSITFSKASLLSVYITIQSLAYLLYVPLTQKYNLPEKKSLVYLLHKPQGLPSACSIVSTQRKLLECTTGKNIMQGVSYV